MELSDLFGDESSDWHYALYEAVNGHCGTDTSLPDRLELKSVVAAAEGENDGAEWVAVFMKLDGTFALLSAGCDYTGWDCRAGGSIEYADTLEDLCRLHMSEDQRHRLGFDVFGGRVNP